MITRPVQCCQLLVCSQDLKGMKPSKVTPWISRGRKNPFTFPAPRSISVNKVAGCKYIADFISGVERPISTPASIIRIGTTFCIYIPKRNPTLFLVTDLSLRLNRSTTLLLPDGPFEQRSATQSNFTQDIYQIL